MFSKFYRYNQIRLVNDILKRFYTTRRVREILEMA